MNQSQAKLLELLQQNLLRGAKMTKSEEKEFKLDPELEKKLVDDELKAAVDIDYRLLRAKKMQLAKDMEDYIKGRREAPPMEEKKEEKKEKKERMFSIVNGRPVPDEEGDYTFKEALQTIRDEWERKEKEKERESRESKEPKVKSYILSGETLQEVDGVPIPVVRQAPPETYVLSGEELTKLEAGKPIIIRVESKASEPKSPLVYVFDQQGNLIKESKPGEPIIIKVPAAPTSSVPPAIFQVKDKNGNPVTLDLDTLVKYTDWQDKRRREEEKHEQITGLVKSLREDIVPAAGDALKGWGGEGEVLRPPAPTAGLPSHYPLV